MSNPPPALLVQTALIGAQVCFGLGSIVSALGLPACNPFAFALYREVAAGSTLWILSTSCCCSPPRRRQVHSTTMDVTKNDQHSTTKDWCRFLLLGATLFGNQACVIAGIKLIGPVAAAVWQPSQPIMTAALSMMLGWEPIVWKRVGGVVVSFLGCAWMVLLSTNAASETSSDGSGGRNEQVLTQLVGHGLFFSNCLCTTLFVILSKKPLQKYPAIKVTAWTYLIAAIFMVVLSYGVSLSAPLVNFLCPDCIGTWAIPRGAMFALLYSIVFNSVLAYFLITWSNQYATGTLVIGYSVLQPVTAALLTIFLLGVGLLPSCTKHLETDTASGAACLDAPGWNSVVGMVGVGMGLLLVILTEPPNNDRPTDGSGHCGHTHRYGSVGSSVDGGTQLTNMKSDDIRPLE